MHTQENSPGPINDDMEIVDHGSSEPGPFTTRPAKQHATAQDWTRYRTVIADLYTRMALKEVIEYMATKYRFFATARMYKSRLREWGLNKYVKAKDMEALVQQAQTRPQDDATTDLEIGGRTVPLAKVARFARRQGQKLPTEITSAIQSPTSSSATPSRRPSDDRFTLVDIVCREEEQSPPSATESTVSSPVSMDLPPITSRILPPPQPVPRPMILPPLVGGREPSLTLPPIQQLNNTLPTPSQTQGYRERPAPSPNQSDLFRRALLIAVILSALSRHMPPLGELEERRTESWHRHIIMDSSILSATVDLIAALSLDQQTTFLAAEYLFRFDRSPRAFRTNDIWPLLIVALRLAELHLNNETYPAKTWIDSSPLTMGHMINANQLDHETSIQHKASLEPGNPLHITSTEISLSYPKFSHIAAVLSMAFNEGRLQLQTADQRLVAQ